MSDLEMNMHAEGKGRIEHAEQTYVAPGAHLHKAPPNAEEQRAQQALDRYLATVRAACQSLQLSGLDASEYGNAPMHLARVYIGLNITAVHPEAATEAQQRVARRREPKPVTVIQALLAGTRHLMLLGAPGGGKSTFVNHLMLMLAEAALAERKRDTTRRDAALAHLGDWNAGVVLPIRVILRDFAAFLDGNPEPDAVELLQQFCCKTYASCQEAIPPLVQALYDGNALLMLDGLDEVVGDTVLPRMKKVLTTLVETFPDSPVLLTCRIRDYQENPLRQIARVRVETLDDFNDDQIDAFVQGWYQELQATGREARGTATALQHSIAARRELRRLAGSPLLLTMMAIVHAGKGELPEARALLYAECIELLLLRWRKPTTEQPGNDLLSRLNLPNFNDTALLAAMAALGYAAHSKARRAGDSEDEPADLSQSDITTTLDGILKSYLPYDKARRDHAIVTLLHEIAGRNGLLLQRSSEGEGAYAFPHRTFQEFLAAYHLLVDYRTYLLRSLQHAAEPHWHEALSLMVGYQVLNKPPELERPRLLVEKLLLTADPLQQVLAGELLHQIGSAPQGHPDEGDLHGAGLWGKSYQQLQRIAYDKTTRYTPALRVRAADAAGLLGYGKLESWCTPEPRILLPARHLPLALLGTPFGRTAVWRAALRQYWCHIPAGNFWYGNETENEPLQQITLDYDYLIGRFPVTNAEYARFIAANGYDLSQPCWTEEGREQMEREQRTQPYSWNELLLSNPLQPVTGITWYEAVAYCNWLTGIGQREGWLAAGSTIRLPTSLEWERAARGTDQRHYPWGNEPLPTPQHANYDETGIRRPSPVGCFPLGNAPSGCSDMAGNVSEWLATLRATLIQREAVADSSQGVLISYAAYGDKSEHLCCGARFRNNPFIRVGSLGFRCILSLTRRV